MAKKIASSTFPLNMKDMQDYFRNSAQLFYTSGSINSYISYVNKVDVFTRNQVVGWINNVIMNDPKPDNPVQAVMNQLDSYSSSPSCLLPHPSPKEISGFKKFVQAVTGYFYANTWLTMGKENDNHLFCKLIAKNALFASIDVVNRVKAGKLGTNNSIQAKKLTPGYKNPFASWDYMEHVRNNQNKKGTKIQDLNFPMIYPGTKPYMVADDNTSANQYIKRAVLETFKLAHPTTPLPQSLYGLLKDYEACHVWDKPKEREYYASIPNLVLLPRGLAQLTDHNDAVKELLRYEVYYRFKFYIGNTPPNPPKNYSAYKWRQI